MHLALTPVSFSPQVVYATHVGCRSFKNSSLCVLRLNTRLSRGHLSSHVTYHQRTDSQGPFLMSRRTTPANPRREHALLARQAHGVLGSCLPGYSRRPLPGPRSSFLAQTAKRSGSEGSQEVQTRYNRWSTSF